MTGPSTPLPPEGTPAGWYWDPWVDGWRWWTGSTWTSWTSPGSDPPDQRVASIFGNARLAAWVRTLTGVGALVATGVLAVATARHRPVPGAAFLLLPGIPLLAAGQIWAILTLGGPNLRPRGRRRPPLPSLDSVVAFFERVPAAVSLVLFAAMIFASVSVSNSFGPLGGGQPSRGRGDCPYELNSHGAISCVSRATYEQAVTSEQRAGAGTFAGLLAFQCLASWSDLGRRRPRSVS